MSTNVKHIEIETYNYDLPDHKIAKFPLAKRDQSKLLLAQNNHFEEHSFSNIHKLIPQNSLLVFNETRVVQARLFFPKNEQTTIEVFCLQPIKGMDIQHAMAQQHNISYQCLVGGARKWKQGELQLKLPNNEYLWAEKKEQTHGVFTINFRWSGLQNFAEILELAGQTPLPPYLNRAAINDDKERYQTLFAKNNGSVAAPTASLHFSKEVLQQLKKQNIASTKLTLHVGAGTFKPVESQQIGNHAMHAEEIWLSQSFITDLLNNINNYIIPVGTTALRAIESTYWLGYLASQNKLDPKQDLYIPQWIAYETEEKPTPKICLRALLEFMQQNKLDVLQAQTAIIIAPSYKHQVCKGLITNFHQPKSTLLLLVASLLGEQWKTLYNYALTHDFRFLSYGDSCLILK